MLEETCTVRREYRTVETQVVFWCYDDAQHAPAIKGWTQAGRATSAGRNDVVFDVESPELLPAGAGSQSLHRTADHRDRTARGIRDFILGKRCQKAGNLQRWCFVALLGASSRHHRLGTTPAIRKRLWQLLRAPLLLYWPRWELRTRSCQAPTRERGRGGGAPCSESRLRSIQGQGGPLWETSRCRNRTPT